jgi:hypothetical protein
VLLRFPDGPLDLASGWQSHRTMLQGLLLKPTMQGHIALAFGAGRQMALKLCALGGG